MGQFAPGIPYAPSSSNSASGSTDSGASTPSWSRLVTQGAVYPVTSRLSWMKPIAGTFTNAQVAVFDAVKGDHLLRAARVLGPPGSQSTLLIGPGGTDQILSDPSNVESSTLTGSYDEASWQTPLPVYDGWRVLFIWTMTAASTTLGLAKIILEER